MLIQYYMPRIVAIVSIVIGIAVVANSRPRRRSKQHIELRWKPLLSRGGWIGFVFVTFGAVFLLVEALFSPSLSERNQMVRRTLHRPTSEIGRLEILPDQFLPLVQEPILITAPAQIASLAAALNGAEECVPVEPRRGIVWTARLRIVTADDSNDLLVSQYNPAKNGTLITFPVKINIGYWRADSIGRALEQAAKDSENQTMR